MSESKFLNGPTGCEWTIGLEDNKLVFCGGSISNHPGSCYCDEHRALAYEMPPRAMVEREELEIRLILSEEGDYIEVDE